MDLQPFHREDPAGWLRSGGHRGCSGENIRDGPERRDSGPGAHRHPAAKGGGAGRLDPGPPRPAGFPGRQLRPPLPSVCRRHRAGWSRRLRLRQRALDRAGRVRGAAHPGRGPALIAPVPPTPRRGQWSRETGVFAAPEGGQYGTLQPGAPARVVGRSGDWARVQLEGWVRDSRSGTGSPTCPWAESPRPRSEPTRARYVGRTVDWRLELIAVQTADELRTEMPKGQPYLLTRGPLPEPGFVYVTVTEAAGERVPLAPGTAGADPAGHHQGSAYPLSGHTGGGVVSGLSRLELERSEATSQS